MANGFNHAKLKQRIAMMHKKHSPSFIRYAYVGVLPFIALTMFACNPSREKTVAEPEEVIPEEIIPEVSDAIPATLQYNTVDADNSAAGTKESVPFALVDVKPQFQGGDAKTFATWVSEHLSYPDEAKEAGISGRALLEFTISETGKLGNIKVLRSVHPIVDAEAVRVVQSSPDWTPGKDNGQPVPVTYQFPVIFTLR